MWILIIPLSSILFIFCLWLLLSRELRKEKELLPIHDPTNRMGGPALSLLFNSSLCKEVEDIKRNPLYEISPHSSVDFPTFTKNLFDLLPLIDDLPLSEISISEEIKSWKLQGGIEGFSCLCKKNEWFSLFFKTTPDHLHPIFLDVERDGWLLWPTSIPPIIYQRTNSRFMFTRNPEFIARYPVEIKSQT